MSTDSKFTETNEIDKEIDSIKTAYENKEMSSSEILIYLFDKFSWNHEIMCEIGYILAQRKDVKQIKTRERTTDGNILIHIKFCIKKE
jgi:nucleoside 2-deoxyribosyltransferase